MAKGSAFQKEALPVGQKDGRVWIVTLSLGGLWLLGVLVVVWDARQKQRISPPGATVAVLPPERQRESITELPSGDFVGSQACRECHDTIYEEYFSTHGMGRSLAAIHEAPLIEDYTSPGFQTSDGRRYQVLRNKEHVVHREAMFDLQGDTLFDESVVIQFLVGSGQRGRGYLYQRNGRIYQSPISWYTQRKTWDLSPGYPPGQHERFLRRITADCLFCHAGRIRMALRVEDRFADEPFAEAPIGCERCHGPGGEHVRRRSQGLEDRSLVAIGKLEPDRRDAVCWQCHLRAATWIEHPGHSRFAFRPGDLLEQHTLVVIEASDALSGMPAESTVLQLLSSRCYTASGGKLGCIGCHDPHRRPPVDQRAVYYQKKCLRCHEQDDCGLSEAERSSAPQGGLCVLCHMPRLPTPAVPHTALTDHRILRNPASETDQPVQKSNHLFFREERLQIEPLLLQRARGLWWAQQAMAGGPEVAKRAIAALEPLRFKWSGDDQLELLLGVAYAIAGRFREAEACWRRLVEQSLAPEDVYRMLATLYLAQGHFAQARDTARRWRTLYPESPQAWFMEGQALQGVMEFSQAIDAVRTSLDRDPTALVARQLLVALLEATGDRSQAAIQVQWIERFRSATRARSNR